jgi:hypothetical protein
LSIADDGHTVSTTNAKKPVAAFGEPQQVSRSGDRLATSSQSQMIDSSSEQSAHDIYFDPIERAWSPFKVKQYATRELRTFEVPSDDRDQLIGKRDWNEFGQWGITKKEMPAMVYRFPGVEAEIVVPLAYAQRLDRERERRLQLGSSPSEAHRRQLAPRADGRGGVNPARDEDRILPEEIFQVIRELPNPNLVKTIECRRTRKFATLETRKFAVSGV